MTGRRHDWLVGERIHGFAAGCYGRDSYTCRTVEAVGADWVVSRNDRGEVELAAGTRIPDRGDARPGEYCDCDDVGEP